MNEHKFSGKADTYASFRPSYPSALYAWLHEEMGFGNDVPVADIGAGTGIFCAPLLKLGCRVLAVEPNPDMRAQAAKTLAALPGLTLVDAPAEHTTLPDASVAHVTAAQAFHWFDKKAFANECRRILRKDGDVFLVWNNRIADDPVTRDTNALNSRLCPEFKGFSGGVLDADASLFTGFFRDGRYDEREFPHGYQVDGDAFVGRALSSSYAPKANDKTYGEYVDGLRRVFAAHAKGGSLHAALRCRVYWGKV